MKTKVQALPKFERKKSGASYPLFVPEGWTYEPIGDLVIRTKQRNPGSKPDERFTYIDVSAVSNTSFRITEPVEILGSDAPSRARKHIQTGDVLFATVRPTLKRVALVPSLFNNQIASTGYAVLRADRAKLVPAFLYFQLLTDPFIVRMGELQRGASYPAVRESDILTENISIPPLPEQQKITAVLGLVQRAIEQQERLLALNAELKKSLLYQLFTQGLRHEAHQQTTIGPIPESWEVVPLKSLLREPLRNGHSARESSNGTGIRTLTLTAVTQRDFCNENTKLTVADPHRVKDMWLKAGDILVERANTPEYVGLSALYEGPNHWAIYSDLMIRVRLDLHRALPYFVSEYLLTGPVRKYYQTHARSGAGNFPKIDQGTIEKTLIPLPSFDEQKEFVSTLRAADSALSLYRRKHAALNVLFRTLLHQLMTGQIRVRDLDLQKVQSKLAA